MKFGELNECFSSENSEFIRLYQTVDVDGCESIKEFKEIMEYVFECADNYAENNKLKYKYFDLAKAPLWTDLEINARNFILKGYDANIVVDLKESFFDITPFIMIENIGYGVSECEQRINIDDDLVGSMIPYQKELFLEEVSIMEKEILEKLKKVWLLEKQRIDKWVKTCKIDLSKNNK